MKFGIRIPLKAKPALAKPALAKTPSKESPSLPHQIDSAFAPRLFSMLREGYSLQHLRLDAMAGLTVAIVALPLSMAIAIASGASPERGLYTAIIGGFLISLLGGTRHQIGGPAGAFIVLIGAIIERHGYDGLILASVIAGLLMILLGVLRLGSLVKYVPQPVIIGFSAGIAIIIFTSQIKELLGITLNAPEPAAFLPKLAALYHAAGTINPLTFALALGAIVFILALRKARPHWPGFLLAVIGAAILVAGFSLPVETIGSRFGAIPSTLPLPALPLFSLAKIIAVFPDAMLIGALGAIESLLSARIADGMTGERHRSNTELVAQGIANIGSALFGGLCATGTIARTATNIRAKAHGPVAGMLHALYLLVFMLLLAPWMAYIPLAALGAILAVVAWNLAERHAVMALLRGDYGERLVFLATFLLTVFRDLAEGLVVGLVLASVISAARRSIASKK
jgi:sulfate permease, SulP family